MNETYMIMNAYARLNPDSVEANLLKQVPTNYDDILKIWSEGLVKMRREETVSVDKNSEYNKENETKYSDRDKSYLDAVNRGDMETAQRMVDEAAKAAGESFRYFLPNRLNRPPITSVRFQNSIRIYDIPTAYLQRTPSPTDRYWRMLLRVWRRVRWRSRSLPSIRQRSKEK